MVTTTPLVVEMKGVREHFGSVEAVRGIDQPCGRRWPPSADPDGAGNTLTITDPFSAPAHRRAIDVDRVTPHRAIGRGMVRAAAQTAGLLEDLTLAEALPYIAKLFGEGHPVGEVPQRAGITGIADRRVGDTPGVSEQQRLPFTMTPASDPGLLIPDEPSRACTPRAGGSPGPSVRTRGPDEDGDRE